MTVEQHTEDNGSNYDYARYRHGHPLTDAEAQGDQRQSQDGRYDPLATDGGLVAMPGDGALSRQACFPDGWTFSQPNGFPVGARADPESGFRPARTTFYARDAGAREQRFDRLWAIHTGIDGWPACPIDEVQRGHRLDRSRRDTYLLGDATLQSLDVPSHLRERILQLVSRNDCRAFSRHYGGITGATVGFALLTLFEEPTEAKNSPYWDLVRETCSSVGICADDLLSYVFERFEFTEEGC